MNWSESISRAIECIESNLTNDITAQDIADYSYISPFYFQKGFAIVCGYCTFKNKCNIERWLYYGV